MSFEFASRASQGARNYQEDAIAIHAETDTGSVSDRASGSALSLATVLADGMGGHAGGARASELACAHFLATFTAEPGEDTVQWAINRVLPPAPAVEPTPP